MPSNNTVFNRTLLKLMRKNFKTHFPIASLKGMTALKSSSLTSKKYFTVTIPKNDQFPEGFQYMTQAEDAYDAKSKTIDYLIKDRESKNLTNINNT